MLFWLYAINTPEADILCGAELNLHDEETFLHIFLDKKPYIPTDDIEYKIFLMGAVIFI
jgi:hypothetical protein